MYTTYLKSYGTKLWGRENGRTVRESILEDYSKSLDLTLVLDFHEVEILDFSFASEVIGVIISRLAQELYGKHVLLRHMNKFVEENIGVALERPELCALILEDNDSWRVLGKCSDKLTETLKLVIQLKEADTPTIAEALNINIPACNNRLKTLNVLGLIDKEEISAPTGGKQFIYKSII